MVKLIELHKSHMGLLDFFRRKQEKPLIDAMYGSGTGSRLDEMPGGGGEFGLEASNPIPVRGLMMIRVYLGFLATPDYQRIKFERLCSIDDERFAGPTDEYNLSDQHGQHLAKVYINAYAQGTSEKAPRGFIYFRPLRD